MTNYFPGHAGIMPAFDMRPPIKQASFVVFGEPKSKERPRVNQKSGNVYTPKTTRDAEKAIAQVYVECCDAVQFEKYVEMTISFFLGTRRARDGDNMAKLVQDALNGVAYGDDKQIRILSVAIYSSTPERARTEVTLREIEEPVENVAR